MKRLRFAAFGAGFWARYQLSAWRELSGVECVALVDPAHEKAQNLARDLDIPGVYDDAEECLRVEKPDFIDIISPVRTHATLVHLAARHRTPVICQKPMGASLDEAEKMVAVCRESGTPFFIHENWRWQAPIRALNNALESGRIGRPYRARIDMITGFPVFTNQPALKNEERLILADLGSHTLDTARFLFGEAQSVFCRTQRIHDDILGEDVATVVMTMESGATVTCEMAYAGTPVERECFPETLFFVEGEKGSVEVAANCQLRVTTSDGTRITRHAPPRYVWTAPDYLVVQSSMVACNANLLGAMRGEREGETTGEDNLKTVRLVDAAYRSAHSGAAAPLIRN
jgi:D-apiose dehydrogenase